MCLLTTMCVSRHILPAATSIVYTTISWSIHTTSNNVCAYRQQCVFVDIYYQQQYVVMYKTTRLGRYSTSIILCLCIQQNVLIETHYHQQSADVYNSLSRGTYTTSRYVLMQTTMYSGRHILRAATYILYATTRLGRYILPTATCAYVYNTSWSIYTTTSKVSTCSLSACQRGHILPVALCANVDYSFLIDVYYQQRHISKVRLDWNIQQYVLCRQ